MSGHLKYSEVVKTVYFEPIEVSSQGEAVQFLYKAEVLRRWDGRYCVKLYQLDYYKIQPSFYEDDADEQIWILDDTHQIDPEGIIESSVELALKVLIERLNEFYSLPPGG